MATFTDVASASNRLRGKVHRTPVLESLALNNMVGGRILVKAECLQKTGTFKIRGALNRILCLSAAERAKGVVAFSSGNFGQGLAAAAFSAGCRSTIVMPGDAPSNKQARARSYGAEVCLDMKPHPAIRPFSNVESRFKTTKGSAVTNYRGRKS